MKVIIVLFRNSNTQAQNKSNAQNTLQVWTTRHEHQQLKKQTRLDSTKYS